MNSSKIIGYTKQNNGIRGPAFLSIALLSSVCLLTGCKAEKPKEIRKDVEGEIIHSQESMGWSVPIHTVIRDEQGYVVRVYGFYGQRGDKVKIADAHLYQ